MDANTPFAWVEPCLSMRLIRPFVRVFTGNPLLPSAQLKRLNDMSDDARVPMSQALGWLDEISNVLRDPELGLRALGHISRGTGDVLELAAASADTLGEALTFVVRNIKILNEAADFHLYVDDDLASLELRSRVQMNRSAIDYQAGSLLSALNGWLGDLDGFQVWFSYREPSNTERYYAQFAPAQIRFGAPCDAIVFPAARLAERLRSADAPLHAVLRRHAEQLISTLPEDSSLAPRVRKLLLELLPVGAGDASAVAKRLSMSRRTLTRHLERENITFRELLEGVRHQLALRYLERTKLEPQRIAQLLGYSETATFCRAFLRWQGQSATQHRRTCKLGRLQTQPPPEPLVRELEPLQAHAG